MFIIYTVLSQRAEGCKEEYFRIEIETGIVVVELTTSEPIFNCFVDSIHLAELWIWC